ncbi:class I SAM-dependent methyltransferase [Candidatus Omnitrophota bacterium]
MEKDNGISATLHRQGSFYDKKYSTWKPLPSVEMFWKHLGDQIIQSLNISEGKSYLFLGAGDGYLTEYIAEKTRANIIGIDISWVSLKICAGKRCKNTFYLFADAQRLPFKDDLFDGIIAPAILHHLTRLNIAFKEFRRVLIKNGMIFSIDAKDYFLRRPFNFVIKRLISEDEVQFKPGFIENVYKAGKFEVVSDHSLYLFAPIFVPLLRRISHDMPEWLFKAFLKIDISFARVRCLKGLSWVVTVVGRART